VLGASLNFNNYLVNIVRIFENKLSRSCRSDILCVFDDLIHDFSRFSRTPFSDSSLAATFKLIILVILVSIIIRIVDFTFLTYFYVFMFGPVGVCFRTLRAKQMRNHHKD
jgi:hypothetical protein